MNHVQPKIVDGVLVEWGSYLFGNTQHPQQARKVQLPRIKGKSSEIRLTACAVREKLALTARKTPEVMVKISGSGKSLSQIKNHLDYISRNGEVPLETENGELLCGSAQVRELRNDWRDFGDPLPETSKYRETINIVLSMPAGTDRLSVTRAARDFAAALFSENHQYIFAVHNDEPHPHVHVVVKTRGFNGRRLNPNKADLQVWREGFAEKLREHGIAANATKRQVRGILKRTTPQRVLHIAKQGRGNISKYDDAHIPPSVTKALAMNQNHIIHAYKEIARALAASSDHTDRKQAVDTMHFVSEMPALDSRVKEARDLLKAEKLPATLAPDKNKKR